MTCSRGGSLPSAPLLLLLVVFAAGCDLAQRNRRSGPAIPTFNHDIAPIVFERCAVCHRPGTAAPFNLLTYEDVAKRARLVAQVTQSRIMPPWLPDPRHNQFKGERHLSDDEVDIIQRWVAGGAAEGDVTIRPQPPKWVEGWHLGKPDLIVTLPAPYVLPSEGTDVFRSFVVPVPIGAARYVKAVEFRPRNPRIVHHARILVDPTPGSRELDANDPEPGYDGMLVDTAVIPDGQFLGWSPGKVLAGGTDDMVWRLEGGTDLVVQLHLLPTGKREVVDADLGLYFTDRVPTRHAVVLILGSKTIDIAAGQRNYVVEDRYVLPVDVDVTRVYPHAHYLAKEMKGFATLPDGSTQWLIRIAEWNFKWQDEYAYMRPISLPRGSIITMQYSYDNSDANITNPHHPARRVVYGSRSTDEMGDLLLQLTPRNPGDLTTLERGVELKALQADITRFERMVTDDPRDHEKRNALAFRYTRMGEIDKAIAHLKEALRLKPDYVHAHFNLGNVLAARGQLDRGVHHLRRAARLQPNHAEALNNLGYALASLGRFDEAIRELRRALTVNQDYADARRNLGRALASRGDIVEAIDHLRHALRLEPDSTESHRSLGAILVDIGQATEALRHWEEAIRLEPDSLESLSGLAWILATHPEPAIRRPERAVILASKAAGLARDRNPIVLDTLAAALASAGRFDQAVATARMALDAATAAADAELAAGIRARVNRYLQRNPYLELRWQSQGSGPDKTPPGAPC